jgi:HPt (histidine-containing phosphotransfer) domain-containing protein
METPSILPSLATPAGTTGQPVPNESRSLASDLSRQGDGIGLGDLAQSIGLSVEMVLELLHVFVAASLDDLSRIQDAIRSRNMPQVVEAAHSLKGAALSFEFSDISAAARSLEIGARGDALKEETEAVDFIRVRLEAIARSIGAEESQTV